MLIVNEVLNDAEEKQITKAYVKEWLDELRDAAYYEAARDLLDQIAYEDQRLEVEASSQTNSILRSCVSEVILALSSWISRPSPFNINKYGFKPGKKMETWEEIESVQNVS